LKLTELSRAGRSPGSPLSVQLPTGTLQVDQWLRILPGRRYVGRAEWQGRQVLVKLLVGRSAWRSYQQECYGYDALANGGLPTPDRLNHGYQARAGGWLLYDYLSEGESLGTRWQKIVDQPPLSSEQEDLLAVALTALGTLHHHGLWQEDLHFDNLLCHDNKLYWVDCGSIRCNQAGSPLMSEQCLANLGVLFAQLPSVFDGFLCGLLQHYQRGGGISGLSVDVLRRKTSSVRRWRLHDFLGKTGRDCTLFSVHRGPNAMMAVRRQDFSALQPLLADPDCYISQGQILKNGNSSTVVQVAVGGRMLAVKRYNIKGFAHWLRRFWRPSRAWHAWREGHRLAFLGLPAPRPLAMLEQRCCWLRRRAYLVLEYLDGENIRKRFAPFVNSSPPSAELKVLIALFDGLVRERISHGDLKASNLIWSEGRWMLIDLDAVRQHRDDSSFSRAYARDRARFLRNWPEESALHKLLDEQLPLFPNVSS